MNAIVHRRYGTPDVLNPVTIDRPDPGPSQILVRVEAASLNAADLLAIAGKPLFVRFASGGLRRPRRTVPGSDVAGIVEACGPDSGRWRPGDRVVADLSRSGLGGLAEFVAVPRDALVRIPDGVSFEQAAAAPTAASTALQALRETADVHPGDRILIDGASGGVGTFAVQIAKALGAHVTAVCGSSKADTAREIGADVVIPRGSADPLADGAVFDVIYAVNGRRSLADYESALVPGGRFVMTGGSGSLAGKAMLRSGRRTGRSKKRIAFVSMSPDPKRLAAVMELIAGGLIRPLVDRVLPLSAAAAGLRYLQAGEARGKVIVRPDMKNYKENLS